MPRQSRLDTPGALHHIIARGNERRKIFEAAVIVMCNGRPHLTLKEPHPKDYPFTYAHLENIGLIHSTGKKWALTPVGKEFIKCVSDPSIEIEKSQPSAPADAKKPRR
jgi:hypothetical protein